VSARGSILPRKDKTAAQARSSLENSAFQVGVLLAVQRNRWNKRQEDLAAEVGCPQTAISALERGSWPTRPLSERQLKHLFKAVDLEGESHLREFIAWWQTQR
jgi:DNA-binding XRE family transcriptional regulator